MNIKRKIFNFSMAATLILQPLVSLHSATVVNAMEPDENTEVVVDANKGVLDSGTTIPEQVLSSLTTEQQEALFDLVEEDNDVSETLIDAFTLQINGESNKANELYNELLETNDFLPELERLIEIFQGFEKNENDSTEEDISNDDPVVTPEKVSEDLESNEDNELETEPTINEETTDNNETSKINEVPNEQEESTNKEPKLSADINNQVDTTSDNELKQQKFAVKNITENNVDFRGYLSNSNGSIFKTPGNDVVQQIGSLEGAEVKVTLEVVTDSNETWFYIDVISNKITGWIKSSDLTEERIASVQDVKYRGYLTRRNDTINTRPWGTKGFVELRRVNDLINQEVEVLQEASTQRANWLLIRVIGTNVTGWIDEAGITVEKSMEPISQDYRGYLTRTADTISTKPWGTPGYKVIRQVTDLVNREVKVLEEVKTQRATWLYVNVHGTDIHGWIDKNGVRPETISNENSVKYKGVLSRSRDTLNTLPWGMPDFEEIKRVGDLVGTEVDVLKEATTQRATWLYIYVRSEKQYAWIDKVGVTPESITSQKEVNYRGYLSRRNDTINTLPWGVPNYIELGKVGNLYGKEVRVSKEAITQRATWLYVEVIGTNVAGWIDKAGVNPEAISKETNLSQYRGYLSRSNDSINTLPWGVPNFRELRKVGSLVEREVKVLKEAVTQRATWLYVDVIGTGISGWVDKSGVNPEKILSEKPVNYKGVLLRSTDTINTKPWGTRNYTAVRKVGDLVGREVVITKEAMTQRAKWVYITVPGTSIQGWIDNSGVRGGRVIYLDPGHGGIPATGGNPGPVYSGVREQDLNLNISLQVRDRLEQLGYTVVMSRENDLNSYHDKWEPDLYARPAHANEIGADLLVSVHHNAHPASRSVSGIETYIYGTNPKHPPLPENEDSHDDSVRISESRKLANAIHKDLIQNTGANDRGVQDGAFIVVREAKMPAVLLELGFMSNPTELSNLRTNSYQQKLINGIVSGIHNYFLI